METSITAKSITAKLAAIQSELKAPKNLYNKFGKYNYRNCESICEAVKPLLKKQNCSLIISDEIVEVCGRIYVKATARIMDTEVNSIITVSAFAREAESQKGMDAAQITGAASSYARKYALNGLFLLDDTKDADSPEYAQKGTKSSAESNPQEVKNGSGTNSGKQAKVNMICEKVKSDGVDEKKLCTLYKRKTVAEMTETQLDNVLKNWDKIKAMCKTSGGK